MSERWPGYFNDDNQFYFELVPSLGGIAVSGPCCGDVLDLDAAVELHALLGEWIVKQGEQS